MSKSISKHYYTLCDAAYDSTDKRNAFPKPEWLDAIKNQVDDAKRAFVCLQSAILMLLDRGGDVLKSYPQFSMDHMVSLSDYLANWNFAEKVSQQAATYSPLESALSGLSEYTRFLGKDIEQPLSAQNYSSASLHELVAEGSLRDATAVTPIDVAEFMRGWYPSEALVDVYGQDGLGLLYGTRLNGSAQLVGDDFGKSADKVVPKDLENTYSDSLAWFRSAEFSNRIFLDMEWRFNPQNNQGDVLLVNAARFENPFFDLSGDEKLSRSFGALNHCLTAGYKKVIVLVSNHYLTAGQGVARKILNHCLKHGLTHVVQLPSGVLGFRSHQHSVLIFEKNVKVDQLNFVNFGDQANIESSQKGFGMPRRSASLKKSLSEVVQQTSVVSIQSLDNNKRLLSFEVSQFSKIDAFEEFRNRCNFVKLHELVDVFRSHHLEKNQDTDIVQISEIGASSINEFGAISSGRLREYSRRSVERRQAQILIDGDIVLCFRGAPDSFGKVGIYYKKQGEIAIPNQSFVILRFKKDRLTHQYSPELLLWWLKSKYAQKHLKLKSISPDVMRISPRDIDQLEVPIGPMPWIESESQKAVDSKMLLNDIQVLLEKLRVVESTAWQINK
jgi:hypothetical protein